MTTGQIRVIGYNDFDAALQRIISKLGGEGLTSALMAGGFVIERAAKENIKRHDLILTGDLRASIRAQPVNADSLSAGVIVGTDKEYAAIHEFGGQIRAKSAPWLVWRDHNGKWHRAKSVRIPARPYLRPAFDLNRDAILAEIAEIARAALQAGA